MSRNCLPFLSTRVHPLFLRLSCWYFVCFLCCVLWTIVCIFSIFLLAIVLYVFWFVASDYFSFKLVMCMYIDTLSLGVGITYVVLDLYSNINICNHWVTHSVNIGYKNISFYVSRNKLNVTSIPISYRSFRVFSSIIDADRSVTNVTIITLIINTQLRSMN